MKIQKSKLRGGKLGTFKLTIFLAMIFIALTLLLRYFSNDSSKRGKNAMEYYHIKTISEVIDIKWNPENNYMSVNIINATQAN